MTCWSLVLWPGDSYWKVVISYEDVTNINWEPLWQDLRTCCYISLSSCTERTVTWPGSARNYETGLSEEKIGDGSFWMNSGRRASFPPSPPPHPTVVIFTTSAGWEGEEVGDKCQPLTRRGDRETKENDRCAAQERVNKHHGGGSKQSRRRRHRWRDGRRRQRELSICDVRRFSVYLAGDGGGAQNARADADSGRRERRQQHSQWRRRRTAGPTAVSLLAAAASGGGRRLSNLQPPGFGRRFAAAGARRTLLPVRSKARGWRLYFLTVRAAKLKFFYSTVRHWSDSTVLL